MSARARALDLDGAAALVTGAGKGIGRAIADALEARGARVARLDADAGADGVTDVADVRDRAAMRAAVAAVAERLGGTLDVVVANAGVAPRPATLRTIDPDDYDRVIAVNQTGVFNTVHPALEPVIAARGHVVVVASVAALLPGPGGAPYMISKAAAEAIGRTLRFELAPHGATAGVAYFGIVETDMTRSTLDDDPLGPETQRRLPRPLRRRITTAQAGAVVADGIARRAGRTIAPRAWVPIAALRGVLSLADGRLAADAETHRLIRAIEARALDSA